MKTPHISPREDIGYIGHDHTDIAKGLFVIRKTKVPPSPGYGAASRKLIDRIPFPTIEQHLAALRQ